MLYVPMALHSAQPDQLAYRCAAELTPLIPKNPKRKR